jgi:hypothetical protein
MYKFFCFKIELTKIKADSYMPCKAMAHSTKSDWREAHSASLKKGSDDVILVMSHHPGIWDVFLVWA